MTKVEIYKNDMVQDIIFTNKTMSTIIDEINNTTCDINQFGMNKTNIILNVYLEKNESDKTNIKQLLDHYSDSVKKYEHTIGALLKLKNIDIDKYDNLVIEYLHMRRLFKIYELKTILDKHICDLYNLC